MCKSNGFAKSIEAVAELVADLVAVAEVKPVVCINLYPIIH